MKISNAQVVAQARAAAHPTQERDIKRLVAQLPLAAIATACPVHKELYGTTVFVFNEVSFARAWMYKGFGRGFDLGVDLAQQRIERAQRAADKWYA